MKPHEHDPLAERLERNARIPGERDVQTLTHRQPGAVGGRFNGEDTPSSAPHNVMDDETIKDRKSEGGAKVR